MPKIRDIEALNLLSINLKRFRLKRGYTQEELANKAGMEFSTISRIERGLLNASISLIFTLAKALEIKPSQLIDEVSD